MANSLFDDLLGSLGQQQVEQIGRQAGTDPRQTQEGIGGAISAILRGLERKTEAPGGADDLWQQLERQRNQGHIPARAPGGGQTQIENLDPQTTDSILKDILGVDPSQAQGRFGKVIKVDPATTKKIFGAVLPIILGALRGQAEASPKDSPIALPDILKGARQDLDRRQPKSGGVFGAILDKDHDGDVDLSDLAGILLGGGR